MFIEIFYSLASALSLWMSPVHLNIIFILPLLDVEFYKCQFDWVCCQYCSNLQCLYWFMPFLKKSFTETGVWKPLRTIVDLSVSPFSSAILCFIYFEVLFLGEYPFMIAVSSWWIDLFKTVKCFPWSIVSFWSLLWS